MEYHVSDEEVEKLVCHCLGWYPVKTERRSGSTHDALVLISDTDERVVLRYPREEVPDWIESNLGVYRWLRNHGIRTPGIIQHGTRDALIGRPWLLVEYGGDPLDSRVFSKEARVRLMREAGRSLAQIHRVEFSQPGIVDTLTDELSPKNHDERRRQGRQAALAWLAQKGTIDPSQVGKANEVIERATKGSRLTLCHGDFTNDNLLVSKDEVVSVVDWESGILVDNPYIDLARWEMVTRMWHGYFDNPLVYYFNNDKERERFEARRLPLVLQELLIPMHRHGNRDNKEINRRFHMLFDSLWPQVADLLG